jgi:hypothetical protein
MASVGAFAARRGLNVIYMMDEVGLSIGGATADVIGIKVSIRGF